jgi:hypothetical protein
MLKSLPKDAIRIQIVLDYICVDFYVFIVKKRCVLDKI